MLLLYRARHDLMLLSRRDHKLIQPRGTLLEIWRVLLLLRYRDSGFHRRVKSNRRPFWREWYNSGAVALLYGWPIW